MMLKENKSITKISLLLNSLLFLVGFSIPFSFAFNSIIIFLFFIVSFYWFDKSKYLSFGKKSYKVLSLFILLFIIQIFGICYSENYNLAIVNVSKSVVFLILPLAFINISHLIDSRKLKISLYGLMVGVLLMLISAHVNIFYKILSENLPFVTILTHFTRTEFVQEALVEIHPPYFAILIVVILAPLSDLEIIKNKVFNKIFKYFLFIYLLFSLYGISSFMSLLLVLLFLFFYIIYMLKKKKGIITIFIIIILASSTFFFSTTLNKSVSDFGRGSLINRIDWMFLKGKGDTSRPHNWKSVLLVVKDNVFFGAGTDGGLLQLQRNRDIKSESFVNQHNAHNQYLEILLRHGLLGFFCYFGLLFYLIKSAYYSKDKNFRWFVLVFLISSITESYLQRQIGVTFFTFYAIIYLCVYKVSKNKKI